MCVQIGQRVRIAPSFVSIHTKSTTWLKNRTRDNNKACVCVCETFATRVNPISVCPLLVLLLSRSFSAFPVHLFCVWTQANIPFITKFHAFVRFFLSVPPFPGAPEKYHRRLPKSTHTSLKCRLCSRNHLSFRSTPESPSPVWAHPSHLFAPVQIKIFGQWLKIALFHLFSRQSGTRSYLSEKFCRPNWFQFCCAFCIHRDFFAQHPSLSRPFKMDWCAIEDRYFFFYQKTFATTTRLNDHRNLSLVSRTHTHTLRRRDEKRIVFARKHF